MISRLSLHTSISCSYDLYVKQDTTITNTTWFYWNISMKNPYADLK